MLMIRATVPRQWKVMEDLKQERISFGLNFVNFNILFPSQFIVICIFPYALYQILTCKKKITISVLFTTISLLSCEYLEHNIFNKRLLNKRVIE